MPLTINSTSVSSVSKKSPAQQSAGKKAAATRRKNQNVINARLEAIEAKINNGGLSEAETTDLRAAVESFEGLVEKLRADVRSTQTVEIKITSPELTEQVISGEIVNEKFELILRLAYAGVNIFLPGPTGSGKTYTAAQIAKAMGRPFYFMSCSAGMTEGQLFGRLLPTGKGGQFEYSESDFVKAWEQGGVFLFDEIDAADDNVLVSLNAALAGTELSLPNRLGNTVAKRHADFVCIAAANTFGTGATRDYCGRNQLDDATMNRFQMGMVPVDYSDEVERQITTPEVYEFFTSLRKVVRENRIRKHITTRTMADSMKLIKCGFTMDEVKSQLFNGGWSADEMAKVKVAGLN